MTHLVDAAVLAALCAAAMMAMKKKKMYESQLEQVENNILRVNEQQMGLENMRVVVEAVDALRVGADAQKATMKVRGRGGLCSAPSTACLPACMCSHVAQGRLMLLEGWPTASAPPLFLWHTAACRT